jgi:AcrR family transcriptional regulator
LPRTTGLLVEEGAVPNYSCTIRYPSGVVEHRYGRTLPGIGDVLGRNGDEGFVTNVVVDDNGHATVIVGTRVPRGVTWGDLAPAREGEVASSRERILRVAYDLFSRRGIRAVGIDELVETAGVSKATLYRHFRSKDDIVLAFLQRREQRWTRDFVESEARRRGSTPRARLLAIFDVFDEWFHRDDFEGCSFINVLLETSDLEHPVGEASAAHLEYIRSVVQRLAEEAGLPEADAEAFAHSWHILMKGSIVAAGEGDLQAAQRARSIGVLVLDQYLGREQPVESQSSPARSETFRAQPRPLRPSA